MRKLRFSTLLLTWNIVFIIQVLSIEPEFSEPIPNATAAVGREAILECIVKNLDAYKVAWIKHDTQTLLTIHEHVITRDTRIRVTHNNFRQWFLHIKEATVEDKGQYMCQINTEPMISQLGYLDIMIPPSINEADTSSDTIAEERAKVSLKCAAEGYPSPNITWRREDGKNISLGSYGGKKQTAPKVDGDVLSIPQVGREDMGAYLCIATNGIPPSVSKRILLQVNFRPKIRVPNQLIGAPAGSSVVLDCKVEASPSPLTSWIRSDGLLLLDGKKYQVTDETDSYRTSMRLTITEVNEQDFGSYKCVAKNTLGEKEGYIRLYEIPPPTTSPKITTSQNLHYRNFKEKPSGGNETMSSKKPVIAPATNSLMDESQDFRTEKALRQSKKNDWSGGGTTGNDVTGRSYQSLPENGRKGTSGGTSSKCSTQSILTLFSVLLLTRCISSRLQH